MKTQRIILIIIFKELLIMKRNYFKASCLVACVVLVGACEEVSVAQLTVSDNPRPVKVKQIEIIGQKKIRIIPGEVQASEQAVLSFRVAGEISEILVRPGHKVKAGDLLATLDPEVYEQSLEVSKAEFALSKTLFNRAQQLVKNGFISRNDYDKAKSALATSQATLDKSSNDLRYTKLIAPYDGTISISYAEQFAFVADKQEILGIQSQSFIDVIFELQEGYIGKLQQSFASNRGKAIAHVNFDGKEQWIEAHLKEMSTVADIATGSYTIVLTLPAPQDINAYSGMQSKVKLKFPSSTNLQPPHVPQSALLEEDGKQFVFRWLPETNTLEKVAVKVNEGTLEEGLNNNDWLVTTGAKELTDGQSVTRWVKERGL
jgi:RND family efflux transporter MFP subunit